MKCDRCRTEPSAAHYTMKFDNNIVICFADSQNKRLCRNCWRIAFKTEAHKIALGIDKLEEVTDASS